MMCSTVLSREFLGVTLFRPACLRRVARFNQQRLSFLFERSAACWSGSQRWAASVLAAAVPVGVVTLEALGLLLEVQLSGGTAIFIFILT